MELFSEKTGPLNQAIGEAMSAYAEVESHLANLLGTLLKTDHRRAYIIFFSAQNARARLEMIEHLLDIHLQPSLKRDFKKFWNSCTKYLLLLARFRNAIAHWHPHTNLYVKRNEDGKMETHYAAALGHPITGAASVS